MRGSKKRLFPCLWHSPLLRSMLPVRKPVQDARWRWKAPGTSPIVRCWPSSTSRRGTRRKAWRSIAALPPKSPTITGCTKRSRGSLKEGWESVTRRRRDTRSSRTRPSARRSARLRPCPWHRPLLRSMPPVRKPAQEVRWCWRAPGTSPIVRCWPSSTSRRGILRKAWRSIAALPLRSPTMSGCTKTSKRWGKKEREPVVEPRRRHPRKPRPRPSARPASVGWKAGLLGSGSVAGGEGPGSPRAEPESVRLPRDSHLRGGHAGRDQPQPGRAGEGAGAAGRRLARADATDHREKVARWIRRRQTRPVISTSEFRNGAKLELDGEPYTIIEFQHVKPGKGGAFVRTKLKSLRTGNVIERTYRSGEKLPTPDLDEREMTFLYVEGDRYTFMDTTTYEQLTFDRAHLGDSWDLLKENMTVTLLLHNGTPIGVELPVFVELRIVKTEPGVRGDTASGGSKPAILESGATIKVPLYIEEGVVVRVDTRTREYVERA